MIRAAMVSMLAAIAPAAARADCSQEVGAAYARAMALPATAGRAALLEQIQRAEVAHHEGDEGECADQLSSATEVLDKAARR